jgi:Ca2+-binding RTX toxin-like protein
MLLGRLGRIPSSGGGAVGLDAYTISGGAGDDAIYNASWGDGGDGNDTITGAYSPAYGIFPEYGAQLFGGAGDDSLVGTDKADYFYGGAGSNTIVGGGGGDSIYLEVGLELEHRTYVISETGVHNMLWIAGYEENRATVDLNAGIAHVDVLKDGVYRRIVDVTFDHIDVVQGAFGSDSITGSTGNDYIQGGQVSTIFGGDGNDTIGGGDGHSQINGNKGDDHILGHSKVGDWLLGGQGNDLIEVQSGANIINGNLGDDSIWGGSGDSTVRGGQGNDVIYGGSGSECMFGDLGRNTLIGRGGADTFNAGPGHDVVTDFRASDGDRVIVAANLTYHATQTAADVLITFGNGGEMVLQGTVLAALPSGWIGAA